MTINAACPFIARLATQNFNDPEIAHIMLGVDNSAILYNAELLTPYNAKIFHDQFGALLERTVEHLAERQRLSHDREVLESERRAIIQTMGVQQIATKHCIIFLMTPFTGYEELELALREVVEDRWNCQLLLARDRVLKDDLRGNVDAHMAQASAFLAEVSIGNPNVMFELGVARSKFYQCPTLLLAHPLPDKGKIELPADLSGLLRLDYALDTGVAKLANHLEAELRKNRPLAALLDDDKREHFVSTRKLTSFVKPVTLSDGCVSRLVERFPTNENWDKAGIVEVSRLLAEEGETPDAADFLIAQIRKGLHVPDPR